MDLPLLGGGDHDWNHMLTLLGALEQTQLISDVFYCSGIAIIFSGIIIGLKSLDILFSNSKTI
jgi:hypothetical protein